MENWQKIISEVITEEFTPEKEKRVKMDIPLPEDVIAIKNVFKEAGFELYLVGGSIRDFILGQPIKDYDLATNAVPDKVQQLLNPFYKTLETGKAFGVINVFTPTGEFEIATLRKDIGSSDGRRPDSVEFTTLDQDIFRRDLTINSLAYDIDKKEAIDYTGGLNDIKNGVIKTVGNPADRFKEDRLRIMRTIRFCARFGSEVDSSVDAALKADASLQGISHERIRDEFLKGTKSAKSVNYFCELLNRYGLFNWIFGKLNYLTDFIEERDYIVLIAYILQNNPPQTLQKELNSLTYTIEEVSKIVFLVNFKNINVDNAFKLKKSQIHSKIADESIVKFGQWENLDSKTVNAFIEWQLTVKGADLLAQGLVGVELGQELERLEKQNFLALLK